MGEPAKRKESLGQQNSMLAKTRSCMRGGRCQGEEPGKIKNHIRINSNWRVVVGAQDAGGKLVKQKKKD